MIGAEHRPDSSVHCGEVTSDRTAQSVAAVAFPSALPGERCQQAPAGVSNPGEFRAEALVELSREEPARGRLCGVPKRDYLPWFRRQHAGEKRGGGYIVGAAA